MEPWMQKLMTDIERIAGGEKLSHYQVTILPQILTDFFKMLQGQPSGKAATERYRMEDGSMEIELKGLKQSDGSIKITDARAYKV